MNMIGKLQSGKELKYLFPDTRINLEILAEEAAEVIQAKSKVCRFGLLDTYNDTTNPDQTNQEKLEMEVGHFLAVVDVLIANGILRPEKMEDVKPAKWEKMVTWNKYKGKGII